MALVVIGTGMAIPVWDVFVLVVCGVIAGALIFRNNPRTAEEAEAWYQKWKTKFGAK